MKEKSTAYLALAVGLALSACIGGLLLCGVLAVV